MTYGSLLGTVRHKGFIPWDDDIDVMVLRTDVEKLKRCFNNERYGIMNYSIDKKYFSPLLKVYDKHTELIQNYGQVEGINLGVYVDVFVLDNVPIDPCAREVFYKKAERKRFEWSLSCRKFSAKSRNLLRSILGGLVSIPFKLIGYHYFAKRYDRFASSLTNTGAYGIVVYGEGFSKEYVYSLDDLKGITDVFEGIPVCIPTPYKEVLTKCYGDYMKLPPVEERKKHLSNAYYNSEYENDKNTTHI